MTRAGGLILLAVVATLAAAAAYSAYATDAAYQRLIAAGDGAAARPFEAIEAYSAAIARKPESMLAYLKRGMVYREQAALSEAVRDLTRAVDLDPTATRAREALGDVSAEMGRHDRAADQYGAYIEIDDRSARVQYKLALARYRSGRPDLAVQPLLEAIALDGTLAEAHYLLGLCRRDLGQPAEARAALERARQLAPALAASREALAVLYESLGRPRQAIDELEALAALEPERPERAIAVGFAHARAGGHDAAVLALRRALDRFPDSPAVYGALGRIWLGVADARNDRVALGKAVQALAAAAAHPDAGADTLAAYGRALMLAGDDAAAERAFRQAVDRLPVPPDAYLQLATLLGRQGLDQSARDLLVRYVTLGSAASPPAGVLVQIADLSVRLGEPARAIRWFERALDEAGPSVPVLARLADAALRAGDLARARSAITDARALAPPNAALQALARRLAAATRDAARSGDPSRREARPPGS